MNGRSLRRSRWIYGKSVPFVLSEKFLIIQEWCLCQFFSPYERKWLADVFPARVKAKGLSRSNKENFAVTQQEQAQKRFKSSSTSRQKLTTPKTCGCDHHCT